jgi:hypothetical protein
MARVVHFEIHAAAPQKLIDFYTALFGWSFQKYGPMDYWVIVTGPEGTPGINGGLVQRRGASPAPGATVSAYVCTVQVDALDETVAKSLTLGAVIALPRMPIPGVGWLAYIIDPDGNILGLMQPDEKAA